MPAGRKLPLALPQIAGAEALKLTGSTKSRLSLFDRRSHLLDGQLAKQYQNSVTG